MRRYDVITTGRVGVDLYAQQIGVPLAEVETFAKYLGGTATNVAVQAACRSTLLELLRERAQSGSGQPKPMTALDESALNTSPRLPA
jgi:hypothetical protein